MQYVVGIDLGGTKIELGVVDETGHVHLRQRMETLNDPDDVEIQIIESVRSFQKQMPIAGVGIGLAGQINNKTGEVIFAPNLKWKNIPLKANLEKKLQMPVLIVNDVRAITMGEWLFGAGKGCEDLLCVFVGTGIGGGFVSHGHLLKGCSNTFGEVGHMTIDLNGPLCTCGKKGCWEALAGGWSIAASAREAIQQDQQGAASKMILNFANNRLDNVSAKIVVQAYHRGDLMAKQIIEHVQKALIAGFASLVNCFNPCRIIIGGGVVEGMPEIIESIDKGVRQIALQSATQSLEVVHAKLGKESGVIGSAAAIFALLNEQKV